MYKVVTTWALVDTGAGSGLIDPEIVRRLELSIFDTGTATTVNAETRVNRFNVLVSAAADRWDTLLVAERPIGHMHGAGMILGCDWLNNKSLLFDGPRHRFTITW